MLRPRMHTPVGRSSSGGRHSTGMYFTDVDVSQRGPIDFNIRSSEDISSGYSSAEPISIGLSRTSSMTNASKARIKSKKSDGDALLFDVSFTEEGEYSLNRDDVVIGIPPRYILHKRIEDDFINEVLWRKSHNKSRKHDEQKSPKSDNIFSNSASDIESRMNESDDDENFEEFSDVFSNEIDIRTSSPIKPLNVETNEQNDKTVGSGIYQIFNNNLSSSGTKIDDNDSENINEEFLDTISTTSEKDIRENLDSSNFSQPEEYNQVNIEEMGSNLNQHENIRMRPKELKLALEEIKENFRINIDSTNPEAVKKGGETQYVVKTRHNKGKAPAPPSSDKTIDVLDGRSTASLMRPPSPANENNNTRKGNLFKNIKSNLFRTAESKNYHPSADQRKLSSSSIHRETEI